MILANKTRKIMTGIMNVGSEDVQPEFVGVVFEAVDVVDVDTCGLTKVYGPPTSFVSRGFVSFKKI